MKVLEHVIRTEGPCSSESACELRGQTCADKGVSGCGGHNGTWVAGNVEAAALTKPEKVVVGARVTAVLMVRTDSVAIGTMQ